MIRRFNRYELKYVIDARRYRELLADLRHFVRPDPMGDGDGFYRVTSLYYDSPTFAAYRSKVDGLKFRRKLRLRVYPRGADPRSLTEGHVEIKQRVNRTVQKRRVVLPLAAAADLCRGVEPIGEFDALDQAVISEVHYMVRSQHLRPACIVAYRRQAFVTDRYDAGMRITFDMQLEARVTSLAVQQAAKLRPFLPRDRMIMEVKVNERVPHWAVALLAKHECTLQRYSKYCAALEREKARLENALRHRAEAPWLT